MKKTAFILFLVLLSLLAVNITLTQAEEMACPGHDGSTIASLKECVLHAYHEGHITSRGIAISLVVKLDVAQWALDRGYVGFAINRLNSFIREVQAQSGKHIHADHAMHMIEHAQRVIAALRG